MPEPIRRLTPDELGTLPYFRFIALLWVAALHVRNRDFIGHGRLNREFWERMTTALNKPGDAF